MAAYPITSQASTYVSNLQSKAGTANAELRWIILTLRNMLDQLYVVPQLEFGIVDFPEVDTSDLPDLIAEVEGYLDQILADAQAIDDLISNGSQQAIDTLEALLASIVPTPDPNTALTVPTISSADGVLMSNRAAADTERREAEVAILGEYAARNFPLPPGVAVGEISGVRLKMASGLAEEAAKILAQQEEQNVKLFITKIEQSFKYAVDLINAWQALYTQTLAVIGQIIADYESSPLVDAEVAAKTASALADAYAGLNRSCIKITEAAGVSYKAELAPFKLQALEDTLQMDAYEAGMKLTMSSRMRVASALSSAIHNAGSSAAAAMSAIGAHGSFTERAFS